MSYLIAPFMPAARWLRFGSKRGASAVEYGLLGALMALLIIVGVSLAGEHIEDMLLSIADMI